MLRSPDSCSAVASAIVTARSGMPRVVPTAEIVAAFAACSEVSRYVRPSPTEPSADSTVHWSEPVPPVTYCTVI